MLRTRQTASKSTGGKTGAGGDGGGRKRPICLGKPGLCRCPRCCEKLMESVEEVGSRRKEATASLAREEEAYIASNVKKSRRSGDGVSVHPNLSVRIPISVG
jgi:hypothetical protein